ncbi:GNAT family N-acetyltransferase [Pseudomonas reactans]|nr:GNAT family N-acetyltransferase [Pseudomonas reactans]NWF18215.1 GNAT family N-acetyltransferase [Pseudomonas reactans]
MALCFRVATRLDVPELLALEQRCFTTDKLSRRSFQWMVSRAHGQLLVADNDGQLLGYALVLLRRGTSLARLYSIAITEPARGTGLGKQLLSRVEAIAVARGCTRLRLEVRTDNPGALSLYERNGYRRFALIDAYYEDHTAALRLEKTLSLVGASLLAKIAQTPR